MRRFLALLAGALVLLAVAAPAQAQIDVRAASSAATTGDIVYVGSGGADNANGCSRSISPSTPAGSSGDLLIALVSSDDSATLTPSTGWNTLLSSNPTATHTAAIYWRFADGSANDNLTVSKGTGTCNVMIGRMARFQGVDTSNPFDTGQPIPASNCTAGGTRVKCSYQSATSVTSGTETTVTANALLLFAILIRDNNTTDASGDGFTGAFDTGTGTGNDAEVALNYRQESTAGAKGPFTVTKGGGSDPNHGVLFALRPASGLVIGVPAGTSFGDLMLASVAVTPSSVTIGAPAGWTPLVTTAQPAATSSRQQTFWRIASASEPASYTWTLGGGHNGAVGGIVSYLGVDTSSPIDASGGNTAPVGGDPNTAVRATQITTTVADAMVVSTHSIASSSSWTPPAGMTERVNVSSLAAPNAAGVSLEMNDVSQAVAGATGDKVATAGNDGDSGTAQMIALRPSSLRFVVEAGDYTLACAAYPIEITISARDASNNVNTGYTGTVHLSTSTGDGAWAVKTAYGTLTNFGSGAADYAFVAGDAGRIVLTLAVTTAGTLAVSVQDASTGVTSRSASINFISDGYVITPDPIQIAGRPQTIAVERRTAPSCNLNAGNGHNGNNVLKIWLTLNGSDPSGAALPGATGVNTVSPLGTVEPGGNVLTIAFSGGAGSFTLNTTDVGKYLINLHDGNSQRRGTSPWITTRPFALAFAGIQHGTSAASSVLAAAGDDFAAAVAGYLWQSSDDSNNDGAPDAGADVTDNGVTPSFAWDTVLAPGAILPAGGTTGTLSLGGASPTVAAASYSGGAAALANLRYSEVGNVLIQATATSYLDTPGASVSGNSGLDGTGAAGGYVGRFRPKRFALSGGTLTNRPASSCSPASSFAYMNEGLQLAFTLTAQNAQGAATQNYQGAYAKLGLTTFANFAFGARSGTTDLTARIDGSLAPSGSWSSGAAGVTATTAIERATPDTPDGPYTNVAFGIAPVDSDGVAMDTLDLDVDGNATNDHKNLGVATEVRYGRLRVQGAVGVTQIPLALPLEVQYWNGSAFATNTLDSCTTLVRSNFSLSFSGSTLAPCETAVTSASVAFTGGVGELTLAAPGAGNEGSLVISPELTAPVAGSYCTGVGGSYVAATSANRGYLLGRWNDADNPDADPSTVYDDDPAARSAFGVYGAKPDNFIFFREMY